MEIELSMNKLVNRDDYFGLVQVEPEPQQFLSIEKITDFQSERLSNSLFGDTLEHPVLFSLSDIERTYEREVYSFMAALGDFGGFNDGIVLIPVILMSIYSQKMFLQELFSLLPVKS